MAEVPYSGVGQVNPETSAPNDYQNIQANPASFGAAIGQGAQQLGAGITHAANFYNQAAVDDQLNKDQERIGRLLRGSGAQTGFGEDGTPQYDTGYMGLQGRDALDARVNVEKQMADIIRTSKENLSTPEQIHMYEANMRRYETMTRDKIGAYADSQAKHWYGNVNKATSDLALSHISANADDPVEVHNAVADLQHAYINQVKLEGGGPEQFEDAINRAQRDGTKAWIESIAVNDPYKAQQMVERNKKTLGELYQPMAMQVKSSADKAYGEGLATQKMAIAKVDTPLTTVDNPIYQKVTSQNEKGFSTGGLWALGQIESGGGKHNVSPGGGYTGIAQMGKAEFKTWGPPGGDINNPEDNLIAANNMAAFNRQLFSSKMNIVATDAHLYLGHQQGGWGAIKLLQNPDKRAGDLVGDEKIRGNGGDPDAPARDFTNMWFNKFNKTASATQSPEDHNKSLSFQRQQALQSTFEDQQAGRITPDQASHTYAAIEHQYAIQKVAHDSNKEMKKDIENKAASDIYAKIVDPSSRTPDLLNEIMTNKDLGDNWQLRRQLRHAVLNPEKNQTVSSPDYLSTLDKVVNHQVDTSEEILKMQINGQLTNRDVSSLFQDMQRIKNDPSELELQKTKAGVLKGIENQIVNFGIQGLKFQNETGQEYFRTKIINRFETEFKQYRQTEEGKKDPYKFFEAKNLKKFTENAPGVANVSPQDLIEKGAPTTPKRPLPTEPLESIPERPEALAQSGVTDEGWKNVMNMGPIVDGKVRHVPQWPQAVSRLLSNTTNPDEIRNFNDYFKGYGVTAEDVLNQSKSGKILSDEEQDLHKILKASTER